MVAEWLRSARPPGVVMVVSRMCRAGLCRGLLPVARREGLWQRSRRSASRRWRRSGNFRPIGSGGIFRAGITLRRWMLMSGSSRGWSGIMRSCWTSIPGWLTGDGPDDLKHRWEHRLDTLGQDPYGDPHRPGPDRIELVTYPEAVAMTGLAFFRPGQPPGDVLITARPAANSTLCRPQHNRRPQQNRQPPAYGAGQCRDR
jgi:hypothetical protein